MDKKNKDYKIKGKGLLNGRHHIFDHKGMKRKKTRQTQKDEALKDSATDPQQSRNGTEL